MKAIRPEDPVLFIFSLLTHVTLIHAFLCPYAEKVAAATATATTRGRAAAATEAVRAGPRNIACRGRRRGLQPPPADNNNNNNYCKHSIMIGQ